MSFSLIEAHPLGETASHHDARVAGFGRPEGRFADDEVLHEPGDPHPLRVVRDPPQDDGLVVPVALLGEDDVVEGERGGRDHIVILPNRGEDRFPVGHLEAAVEFHHVRVRTAAEDPVPQAFPGGR